MSEVKTEIEVVYYLYAKKQIRLVDAIDWWFNPKTQKTLKIDEFIKIRNVEELKYRFGFNIDGVDTKVCIDNNTDCYELYKNLEDVLAKQEKEKAKDKSKYVIKNSDGTLFKDKKYKSLKDTFSAAMAEWGYYNLFESSLTKENVAKNPELESIGEFPYWMSGYGIRPLDELKNIEVHKYLGAKKPTEKVEYDLYSKVAKNFNNLYIALEYGLCVKELYAKMDENQEKEFQYILVYTPKDYETKWEYLKEDDVVKTNIKKVKKGDFIKVTKYGKTAIAFKNLGDILPFYRAFSEDDNKRIKMITLDGREIVCEANAKVEIRKKIIQNVIDLG
jgi:hypothetical protein